MGMNLTEGKLSNEQVACVKLKSHFSKDYSECETIKPKAKIDSTINSAFRSKRDSKTRQGSKMRHNRTLEWPVVHRKTNSFTNTFTGCLYQDSSLFTTTLKQERIKKRLEFLKVKKQQLEKQRREFLKKQEVLEEIQRSRKNYKMSIDKLKIIPLE